jgi:hypothetical protein
MAESGHGLDKCSRHPAVNGWTQVHLEGTPSDIGYQHGYLLAKEIADIRSVVALELQHDTKKEWTFFRREAESMLWPHIPAEYREELQGIADGVQAQRVKLDLWDIVALNAWEEWSYYTPVYDKAHGDTSSSPSTVADHCSAFVATGSYTTDGKVIIAHNNWTTYLEGPRTLMVFDIIPTTGHRILMDGAPGLISSGDDFGMNDAGILITETTITGFHGFDPRGIPEFVRARRAMQYAASIDDFYRMMKEGNNGGYANTWLIADRKNNEIARLELGLKFVTLERTQDGCFVGSNFPISPALTKEETTCDPADSGKSRYARQSRWAELIKENRGKIDVAVARKFMADHYDAFQHKDEPNERTLCGHIDLSPRGSPVWQGPYGPAGTVQNKVADATMAGALSFLAASGHACGIDFAADGFLHAHPEYNWQKSLLRDMPAGQWTLVGIRR